MTIKTSFSIVAGILCAMAWSAQAQTPFAVKPGQWEATLIVETAGQTPIPQEMLDKMTPEQRARFEAAMKARNGQPRVYKTCVKKEELDKPFAKDVRSSCKQTIITSTSTKQEIRMECEEEGGKQAGTLKIEVVDSGNVKGTMQMVATNGTRTMNVNNTYSAKWLGPVCAEK